VCKGREVLNRVLMAVFKEFHLDGIGKSIDHQKNDNGFDLITQSIKATDRIVAARNRSHCSCG